jgi:hypothetical protein
LKFNPAERINLLNVIPKEGTASTLKIIRDLQTALGFTEEEHREFIVEYKLSNGSKYEDLNKDKLTVLKDVAVGEKAHDIIVEALKTASEQKKLHISTLGLYERFVEGKKSAEDLKDEAEAAVMKKANADVAVRAPAK